MKWQTGTTHDIWLTKPESYDFVFQLNLLLLWFLFILKCMRHLKVGFCRVFRPMTENRMCMVNPSYFVQQQKKNPIKSFFFSNAPCYNTMWLYLDCKKEKKNIWNVGSLGQSSSQFSTWMWSFWPNIHIVANTPICVTTSFFLYLSFVIFFHLNVWIIMYCKIRCNISYGVFKN